MIENNPRNRFGIEGMFPAGGAVRVDFNGGKFGRAIEDAFELHIRFLDRSQ